MTSPQFSSTAVLPPEPRFPQHLGRGLVVAAPNQGVPSLISCQAELGQPAQGFYFSINSPSTILAKGFYCQGAILFGLKLLPSFGWVLLGDAACVIKQSVNFTARV